MRRILPALSAPSSNRFYKSLQEAILTHNLPTKKIRNKEVIQLFKKCNKMDDKVKRSKAFFQGVTFTENIFPFSFSIN